MAEKEKNSESDSRQIVVPGETIVSGDDYLPGEGVYRDGDEIVAEKFGLSEVTDRFVKVIPLSGIYIPRRGNVIIGTVIDINGKGWIIDMGIASNAFLSVSEVPKYINQNEMREHFDFGDSVVAKIWNINARGIDLSVKMRGFGKVDEGILIKINPHKVPRIIGKEGSMVKIIKDATNCSITVGQNGIVWINGETIEDELKTKKIIEFICENSFVPGLTEKVEDFIKSLGKEKVEKKTKTEKEDGKE